MAEIREDYWKRFGVIYNPLRAKRPREWSEPLNPAQELEACPFCEGNESLTPPEVLALPKEGRKANQPGWHFRVVPNKYPALVPPINPKKDSASGIHLVIIETPHHSAQYSSMNLIELERFWKGIKEIYQICERDYPSLNWFLFKNQGFLGGASLSHPHSQLMGLPFLPPYLEAKVFSSSSNHPDSPSCQYCEYIQQNRESPRFLTGNKYFTAFLPFATRSPYEISIFSVKHLSSPSQMSDEAIHELSLLWKWLFQQLERINGSFSYNFLLYSLPPQREGRETFHFHIEILPRLQQIAGLELGTGYFLNSLLPEKGAQKILETGKPF